MKRKREQKNAKKIKSCVAGGKYTSIPGDKIMKVAPASQKKSGSKMGVLADGHKVLFTGKCKQAQAPKGRVYRSRFRYKFHIEEIREAQTEVGGLEKKKGAMKSGSQILLHKRNPMPDRPRPVTGKPKPQKDYEQGGQDKAKKENEP